MNHRKDAREFQTFNPHQQYYAKVELCKKMPNNKFICEVLLKPLKTPEKTLHWKDKKMMI